MRFLNSRIQRLLQVKEIEKGRALLERWNQILPTVSEVVIEIGTRKVDGS